MRTSKNPLCLKPFNRGALPAKLDTQIFSIWVRGYESRSTQFIHVCENTRRCFPVTIQEKEFRMMIASTAWLRSAIPYDLRRTEILIQLYFSR